MLEDGLEIKDIESREVTKTYSGEISYKDLNDACEAQDKLKLSALDTRTEEDFDPELIE